MIELTLFWLGGAVAALGSVGILAALFVWVTNQTLEATGYAKIILQWYGEKLTKERDAKRHPA